MKDLSAESDVSGTLSLSHQEGPWTGGDRRGGAGRIGRGWGWCARGPPGIVCSDQLKSLPGGPRVLSYPATLDVPESIAHTICLWLAAHRRAHDVRPWQRAATCRAQAVLLLRWMVAGTALTTLARDTKVSRATAYRYLLRGPGGDRRPGPGPSRGPGSAARVQRAVRLPGRDPDPHRPGGPGATRTRAAICGIRARGRRSGATCRW